MRSRLGHGVVGVGGGEQARGRPEFRAGGSSVVAGAVEPLVGQRGDLPDLGQRRLVRASVTALTRKFPVYG